MVVQTCLCSISLYDRPDAFQNRCPIPWYR